MARTAIGRGRGKGRRRAEGDSPGWERRLYGGMFCLCKRVTRWNIAFGMSERRFIILPVTQMHLGVFASSSRFLITRLASLKQRTPRIWTLMSLWLHLTSLMNSTHTKSFSGALTQQQPLYKDGWKLLDPFFFLPFPQSSSWRCWFRFVTWWRVYGSLSLLVLWPGEPLRCVPSTSCYASLSLSLPLKIIFIQLLH